MKQTTNIQQFDEITAQVFARLYESFPIPIQINCIDLTQLKENDEIDIYIESQLEICIESIKWLQEEDFIQYHSISQYKGYEIRLTAKGLSILKSMPENLKQDKTLGERLVLFAQSGALSASVEILKLILGNWR